ncbi:hypothetical protein Y1Q_0013756 [Alligator mississippiensis]|uniref:Uncharacterized protein n=1 Tax=Alligator mississippiensis TaxID=8496 RepID=A0A151MMC5_ALLMI|nr:hypothetical protein Y1Q_0013756 [Alligator mississippiensis]
MFPVSRIRALLCSDRSHLLPGIPFPARRQGILENIPQITLIQLLTWQTVLALPPCSIECNRDFKPVEKR